MDFVTGLLLLVDWKAYNNDIILVKIDQLINIVNYEVVKTMIDTLRLAKVIINIVVRHHSLLELIISDCRSLFILKF